MVTPDALPLGTATLEDMESCSPWQFARRWQSMTLLSIMKDTQKMGPRASAMWARVEFGARGLLWS